ncbi:hypothetical protein [Endozoicomonas acroporae]|uniref:hypothetical protein n=1 Tax=Endozoicomonas acroporae TaxID=1701104 RepID=UPI003D7B0DB9
MAIDLSMFYTVDEQGNQVELTRPETKSWFDVEQCINHHQGRNDAAVNRFIELYLLGIQWDWFESYKEWQEKCLQVEAYNASLQPDEEGITPEPMPLPAMPERPLSETVKEVRQREYQALRRAAYGETDSQFNEVFDTEDHGASRRAAIKTQYPK